MLIFHDLSRKSEYPTVAALGFFDGVHLGHRAVIAEAVKQARAQNGKGAVFTFEPPHHTDRAVSKSDVKLLQSPESRDRVMEELGVELVLCPPFESFYNFSPEEFVREILKNCLNCRGVAAVPGFRLFPVAGYGAACWREIPSWRESCWGRPMPSVEKRCGGERSSACGCRRKWRCRRRAATMDWTRPMAAGRCC